MKLWILSDLHIEQSIWDLPDPRPDYDVLIAAGDIHFATDAVRWLAERSNGKPVIYVTGNHEWYSYKRSFTVASELDEARRLASDNGVHLLMDSEVTIGDVRFVGAPLWTDYALYRDPDGAMALAERSMNDHRLIYPQDLGEPLKPVEALAWHSESKSWLIERLTAPTALEGKTVVVTHHLPHPRSINSKYAGDALNPAFCSDLSSLVEESGAALWVHGHTHSSCDYTVGRTRVVCNPKGYGPRSTGGPIENAAFNPLLVIEI